MAVVPSVVFSVPAVVGCGVGVVAVAAVVASSQLATAITAEANNVLVSMKDGKFPGGGKRLSTPWSPAPTSRNQYKKTTLLIG